MVKQKKRIRTSVAATTVATFGAAMSSLYVAPEIHGDVVYLTWNGGNETASNPFVNGMGTAIPQFIDQVDSMQRAFVQWNDTNGGPFSTYPPTGRTMSIGSTKNSNPLLSFAVVETFQTLRPDTFTGTVANGLGDGTQFDGSGTVFIGFRSAANNVGWFKMSFSEEGPIIYGWGHYGNRGESVVVNAVSDFCLYGDVNLDGIINLLDVAPFVELLTRGEFQCEADVNEDGVVNLLDVNPFVSLLGG